MFDKVYQSSKHPPELGIVEYPYIPGILTELAKVGPNDFDVAFFDPLEYIDSARVLWNASQVTPATVLERVAPITMPADRGTAITTFCFAGHQKGSPGHARATR